MAGRNESGVSEKKSSEGSNDLQTFSAENLQSTLSRGLAAIGYVKPSMRLILVQTLWQSLSLNVSKGT
ncbi:conserved hypothetical protein [Ricinus communis]|uniref:Uncharacterized protein n=1 Tax=Ricinus communis TaxID=3988 RepID=B9RZU7_RICCO|nr:conserved hypothetical protein [Ricinus communis]